MAAILHACSSVIYSILQSMFENMWWTLMSTNLYYSSSTSAEPLELLDDSVRFQYVCSSKIGVVGSSGPIPAGIKFARRLLKVSRDIVADCMLDGRFRFLVRAKPFP
jgi:hypothetical protein